MLHGVASFPVCDTPIMGLLRSSSVKPIALYIALCGARAIPSTTFLLEISILIKEMYADYNLDFHMFIISVQMR